MQFWGSFIRDIYNVNTARQIARKDEKTSRLTFIFMAGASGISAQMVGVVPLMYHMLFASDKHHSSTWFAIASSPSEEETLHYVFPMSYCQSDVWYLLPSQLQSYQAGYRWR